MVYFEVAVSIRIKVILFSVSWIFNELLRHNTPKKVFGIAQRLVLWEFID